jgi:hypothetical protein
MPFNVQIPFKMFKIAIIENFIKQLSMLLNAVFLPAADRYSEGYA